MSLAEGLRLLDGLASLNKGGYLEFPYREYPHQWHVGG